jgi:hypothetical protein
MEHQESNNAWCNSGNWSPAYTSWPIGEGWNARTCTTGNLSSFEAEFGYSNWSNGASGPFPCAESIVEARRAQLKFQLTPWQLQRATNATFMATFAGGTRGCLTTVGEVQSGPGVDWVQESSGPLWVPLLGIAESSETIIATANPARQWPMVWNGNQLSVNYGKPTDFIFVGFETNDGFANGTDPVNYSYAVETAGCMTTIGNPSLQMTYTPMPPETPLCTAAIACNTTVTCAPSAETFLLEGPSGTVVSTFDGTGGATPTFTAANGTYSVCTQSSAGATACAPVTAVSDVGCAPPPCQPLTCGSFSPGTCGNEPDGCGGTVNCGGCAAGSTCTNNMCVAPCLRECEPGSVLDTATCLCGPAKPICVCGGAFPACRACN